MVRPSPQPKRSSPFMKNMRPRPPNAMKPPALQPRAAFLQRGVVAAGERARRRHAQALERARLGLSASLGVEPYVGYTQALDPATPPELEAELSVGAGLAYLVNEGLET